jgi:DnaJ family protein C protein 3
MNMLNRCLHYDPDSKPCLALYRLVKSLDKFELQNWRDVVKHLLTAGAAMPITTTTTTAAEPHLPGQPNIQRALCYCSTSVSPQNTATP